MGLDVLKLVANYLLEERGLQVTDQQVGASKRLSWIYIVDGSNVMAAYLEYAIHHMEGPVIVIYGARRHGNPHRIALSEPRSFEKIADFLMGAYV